MAKFTKYLLVTLLLMLPCVVVLEGLSIASPQEPRAGSRLSDPQTMHASHIRNDQDQQRIVRVIESKIGSHRMPEEAKEKLSVMEQQDIRLIASLCDHIASADDKAGTDIALLLATALIVLS